MTVPSQTKHIAWTVVANADTYEWFVDGDSQGLVSASPVDLLVPENTTRQITVQGRNGTGVGPLSTAVPATVGNLAPPPVTGLNAVVAGQGALSASWTYPDKPADFTGTAAYVVTATAGTVTVDQVNMTASITGLGDSVAVTVTVRARDSAGLQSSAVTDSATTPPAPPPAAPPTPTNFRVTRYGYSSVTLAWNASAGATSYEWAADGQPFTQATTGATTREWTGLKENTQYGVSVRAVGPGGHSNAVRIVFKTLVKIRTTSPVYATRNYGISQPYPWNQTGIGYDTSGLGGASTGWASGQWLAAIDLNTNTGPYNATPGAWVRYSFTLNFDALYQVYGQWGYPGTYQWDAWDTALNIVQSGRVVQDATSGTWLTPNVKNAPSGNRIALLRMYFYGGGLGSGVYKLREMAISARVITGYSYTYNPA